ncbi:hypothetical protein FisN_4Lh498 [Fistulifera solaris]|uniref:CRAL-TRIO domain-containing protein n=1 Tax=Fistulifera solaris TaxID=1519565 RepID=A0A1Z5KE21_FISSO|nr:hypothetical protein FisN_4Lh498 [Fistulifera solaris]|eukprot:GAX24375.1 hypothetical protein FisN_4Lh498 [Fistulifera solaris]
MKLTKELVPAEILQEIFDSPIPYRDAAEEKLTKDLFGTLSPEDVEMAAQGSYAYWVAKHSSNPPTEEQKIKMAMREARRHIYGVKYPDAVKNIKETCKYRRERNISLYRACFADGAEFETEEEAQFVEKLKASITSEMKKQLAYVRGKDKENRALLVVHPRTDKSTVDEDFIANLIFIVERAAAVTEFSSRGKEEKLIVVLDFGTFSSSLSPPMSAVKGIVGVLQSKYSERLKNLVILDPPLWMRTLYGLIKPFLDPITKAKFIVATGAKKKHEVLASLISDDQAMPFMLPNGKLVGDVEMDRFLKTVPFHCLYDEV